jgi:hypothetical protein
MGRLIYRVMLMHYSGPGRMLLELVFAAVAIPVLHNSSGPQTELQGL